MSMRPRWCAPKTPRPFCRRPGEWRSDGLDEIATPGTGSAVEAVLRQLRRTDCWSFVLTCRTAEWRDAVDRARIENACVGETVTSYLIPFDGDGARAYLEHEFPGVQVPALLLHLKNRGLVHTCRNPLILRMYGEVARAGGGLPETRTELFAGACRALLGYDRRRSVVQFVRREEDDLLLASGAICATLMLCDLLGAHDGRDAATPPAFLNVSDIGGLPFAGAAPDALRTRLFTSEGEGRFSYVHRAIAEYLGAMWLTRCVEEGHSDSRILALFDGHGGVPGCSPVPGASSVPACLPGAGEFPWTREFPCADGVAADFTPGSRVSARRWPDAASPPIPMRSCATARPRASTRTGHAPFSRR